MIPTMLFALVFVGVCLFRREPDVDRHEGDDCGGGPVGFANCYGVQP